MSYNDPNTGYIFVIVIFLLALFGTIFEERNDR